MTEEEIKTQLVWRFTTAQRPLGRWRLNMYVLSKRLSWEAVVAGAHFIKRIFDIVFSFVALILFSWLYLLIAIAVKMDGGPIFWPRRGWENRAANSRCSSSARWW